MTADLALLHADAVGITHAGSSTAAPQAASFTIHPGEVVLLLGPSGCGKSSLALATNGLVPQAVPAETTGTLTVAGLDTRTTPVAQLSTRVGMVFQDPDAQLVTGTVLDEVAFGPENLRLPVEEILARCEEALRQVGLWDRRRDSPDRLSGGGRQRLALACALAMGSQLLVLDEPTANLDPQGIDDVYTVLAEVVAGGDRSVLLIEHNLDAAVAITDRVVVLDAAGRTVAEGGVDDILRGRAEELLAMGVWLPTSALAALTLRARGWALDPLPLTPDELRAALEDAPAPPAGASRLVQATASARPRTEAPVIDVRDLHLRRGRTEVLHGLDLSVEAGEFVAVVGPNGAGKTSLVQAIAGVVVPPRGAVRVAGADISRADPRTLPRRIGFVFQNPEHQFIAQTVSDELAHGLRQQGLDEDAVRERVEDVLERFGLADKADVHPFLLSGGQKRRLSVGTALVAGAPVLALDEPTFGQDRARADELLGLLRELNDDGTTILVVTHDMQLVADYAERTVVLADGRIAADAATAEVFADEALLARTGLRPPPLARALRGVTRHPSLSGITRLRDLRGPA